MLVVLMQKRISQLLQVCTSSVGSVYLVLIRLSEFRPPTMYYTTIPLVSERPHNRRWDASKLRELRKRLDSGTMSTDEVDTVAGDFLDGEIVDLASDWLGNTVGTDLHRTKLFLNHF